MNSSDSVSPRRLKILFVSHWYPTRESPLSGVFILEHARCVSRLHDVAVVVFELEADSSNLENSTIEEEYAGLKTFRLRQKKGGIPKLRYLFRLRHEVRFLEHVVRLIQPDLIHAEVYSSAVPAVIVGRRLGIPVVASEHYSGFYRGMVRGFERWKAIWGLKRTSRVMPVSSFLRDMMIEHGVRAKYEVVPLGVDTELFKPPSGGRSPGRLPVGIVVSSLIPIKGVSYLIEALKILKSRGIRLSVRIVGEGIQRREFEDRVVELDCREMVTFYGEQPKSEVARLMQQSDFYISPSLGETFGLAIAEAMATGLPVVATSVGAVPDLVSKDTGILTKAGDHVALADGIGQMLQQLPAFDSNVIHSRVLEKFTPGHVAAKFDRIYREVLQIT